MKKKLHYINQKIDAIQFALLRYQDKEDRVTVHVTAKTNDDTLICTAGEGTDLKELVNKKVNLIQKSEDDYLYISGEVKEKDDKNKKTLFISIVKACWFVRKSKGTLSWLQEKHIYDISPQEDLELAS